jgi:hypothetical protein
MTVKVSPISQVSFLNGLTHHNSYVNLVVTVSQNLAFTAHISVVVSNARHRVCTLFEDLCRAITISLDVHDTACTACIIPAAEINTVCFLLSYKQLSHEKAPSNLLVVHLYKPMVT